MGIANAFAWSAMEQVGTRGIGLLTQIVLARLLTPEDFGILAILLVVVNVAETLAQAGFGSALIQKKHVDDSTSSTAFWLSIVLAVLMYVILFFVAPAIASFYSNDRIIDYLRVLAILLIFDSANSIQRSLLQRRMDFKRICLANISATLGSAVLGVGCALAGFGIWSLVVQSLSYGILACLLMRNLVQWRPHVCFAKEEAGELFQFGWKMSATGILNTISSGVSDLIVGKACSTQALGYYSQGRKYPMAVMGALSNALSNVLFPAFAKLREDKEAFDEAFERSLLAGNCLFVPIAVFCIVAAEPMIALLLTEKWLPCVAIFQLTCASYALLFLQVVNLRAYMAFGRGDVYLTVHVIRFIANIVIVPLVAFFSRDIYLIAFSATALNIITILLVDIVPAKRIHGYPMAKQIGKTMPIYAAAIFAALSAAAVLSFDLGCLPCLIAQIVVFSLAYALFSKLFGVEVLFATLRETSKTVIQKMRARKK